MKKFSFICIVLLFLISINLLATTPEDVCPQCATGSCSTTFSKPQSGPYSYSEDNYGHELWGYYSGGNYCTFEILFLIRQCSCPETRYEIFIDKILLSPECSGINYSTLISQAVRALVSNTPLIFDISPFPTNWSVIIMINKCWTIDGNTVSSCSTSTLCCKTQYVVSQNEDYDFALTQTSSTSSTFTCPGSCGLNLCDGNIFPLGQLWSSTAGQYCSGIEPCSTKVWNDQVEVFQNEVYDKNFIKHFGGNGEENARFYESTKKCDNGEKYIRLERILLSPALAADNVTNCEILKQGIRGILFRANGYFRDVLNADNTGPYSYHILMNKCWHRLNNTWLVPCNPSECCSVLCQIQYDVPPNCDDPYPGCKRAFPVANDEYENPATCDENCSNCCSMLWSQDVYAGHCVPKIGIREELNVSKDNGTYLFLKPNPAGDEIEIQFVSDKEGIAKINIVNILGINVFESTLNKNNSEAIWQLNTKGFPSGTYYIRITVNEEQLINNKFIITH